ncbi:MAG: TRAP transporter fused permease subunit [Deltaproteobacteria bacterium]|nr:TRAP transporter fused permease subunit [Deltaproteobacteria bacterium]
MDEPKSLEGGRGSQGLRRWIVGGLAIAWSLYQLYVAYFGVPSPLLLRSLHLLAAFVLLFLTEPLVRGQDGRSPAWARALDFTLLLLSAAIFLYIVANYFTIENRMAQVDPVSTTELILGILSILLTLEAVRRCVSPALTIVMLVFLAYTLLGGMIPAPFGHKGFNLEEIVEIMYLGYRGIFGMPVGVAATYVFLFVLWGAFFEKSGVGEFFIKFSHALAGSTRGGPAKIAVISSAMFGTVSGSAVANVYGTGSFTIPMMKSLGYRPQFAGAVEAVASTGGQIMPPVMGAAAFVMAEFLEMPYIEIAKIAAIPAILYFIAVLAMVHLEAVKTGLRGMPRETLPSLGRTLATGAHLLTPLVGLVYLLTVGYTPMRAALIAIVLTIAVSYVRRDTRMGLRDIVRGLEVGAMSAISIAVACAGAGIVVGATATTGFGLSLTSVMTSYGVSLIAVLTLVAITCLILGTAMPTTPAYIMTAALSVPILVGFGVPAIPAHMFIFYFAVISMITPPVAMSAYAGAQIAGASFMKTGLEASRLGIAAYIVPYMFVYGPQLLLFGAALFLIKPGLVTDLAGIGLLGLALLSQRLRYGPGVLEVGEVLRISARQPRVAVVAVEEPLAKGGGAGSA